MKKLLTLLFSILISYNSYGLFGLFEDTVCVDTDAEMRKDECWLCWYLPNETEPFTGNNLCFFENGQKRSEGKIIDGQRNVDGKSTVWWENGHLRSKATFKDGKNHGKWTLWWKNGQKWWEGNYKNGKRVGKFTNWDENGQIQAVWNYKDGQCISGGCPD